jgi:DNA-binding transcriptional MerR regulator
MEYGVGGLAKLAGISARTLRYYDQCGLLSPTRISANGYRVYGPAEVGKLQQILFYREMGVPLDEIQRVLTEPGFDGAAALERHLTALLAKRGQIDALITNVEKTLRSMKGEIMMSDKEKFDGFGWKLVEENERLYGEEIRGKYGEEAVESANAKVRGMSEARHAEAEGFRQAADEALKAAFAQGDPAGSLAQTACDLHRQWLCCYYDGYSKAYHRGLAQTYVDDPRFTAYYDKLAPGCAVFLRDAILIYCQE